MEYAIIPDQFADLEQFDLGLHYLQSDDRLRQIKSIIKVL